jgi:hypothetical protein
MSCLDDSKLIFQQLARADSAGPGGGVHTVIENHDAWGHNTAILGQLSVALRSHLAHGARAKPAGQRIALQQSRLQGLAVVLTEKLPAAG